jgi:hypothetical protein
MNRQSQSGTAAGERAYSGAANCRDLRCGSPPVAARRRSAPPASAGRRFRGNASGDRTARDGWAVLHPPGILSPRKDHSQGRSLRSRRCRDGAPRHP